jgi:peptidoglycan hydrolase-like protein with peptidoglycan-binding domain
MIELFGKLTRVPYWNCLGIDQSHPLIKEEIGDWYFTLNRENKIVPYIQNQLRIRKVYSGPVDGSFNPEFQAVIPKARKALSLSEGSQIDEALFSGLINLKSKGIDFPKEPVANLTVAQLEKKKKPVKKKKRKTRSISEEPEESVTSQINVPKVILNSSPVKPGTEISIRRQSSDAYLPKPVRN